MVKKIGFLVFVFFLTAFLAFVAKKLWFVEDEINNQSSEVSEVLTSTSDIENTNEADPSESEDISSTQNVISSSSEPQPQTPNISIKATIPVEDNNTYSFTASVVGEQPTEAYHYELRVGKTLIKSSKDGTFVNIPPIAGGRYALHLVSDAGKYITSIPVRGFVDKSNPEPEQTPASTQKMLITKEEFQQRMLNFNDYTLFGNRNKKKTFVADNVVVMVINRDKEKEGGEFEITDIQDVRDMIKSYGKWRSARVVELEYDSKGFVTLAKIEPVYPEN